MKYTLSFRINRRKKDLSFLNRHVALCFVAVVAAAISGCLLHSVWKQTKNDYYANAELPRIIAHACGSIDGNTYTNSRDAFEYNYERGQRAFEVDFLLSDDGYLVCRHDWDDACQEGIDSENVPTKTEFEEKLILDRYEPMTIDDVIDLMMKYNDVYIITDTKYADVDLIKPEFTAFSEAIKRKHASKISDRFIIQIYNEEMYDVIQEIYPFRRYIYTMYQIWDGDLATFPQFCSYCNDKKIRYITMWSGWATKDIINTADAYGIKIYIHTVNDPDLAREMVSSGVYGIYTDGLIDSDLEEE